MKIYINIFLASFLLLFSSCRKDEAFQIGEIEKEIPDATLFYENSIQGIVKDDFEFGIENAEVSLYNNGELQDQVLTDEDGGFLFDEVLSMDQVRLFISKEDYVSNLEIIQLDDSGTIEVEVELLEETELGQNQIPEIDPLNPRLIKVFGRTVDKTGTGVTAQIIAFQLEEQWVNYTESNSEGYFELVVMNNASLELNVFNSCDDGQSMEYSLEEQSTDLGEIELDIENTTYVIKGTAVDCDQNPIETASVQLILFGPDLIDGEEYSIQIENGEFELTLIQCDIHVCPVIIAMNHMSGDYIVAEVIPENNGEFTINLIFCTIPIQQHEGYFNISLDGGDSITLEPHFLDFFEDDLVVSFNWWEGVFFELQDAQLGDNIAFFFEFYYEGDRYVSKGDMIVNLTEIPETPTDFLVGTLEGEVRNPFYGKKSISGSFKIQPF